mgnify:CR=1 FL=1
MDTNVIDFQFLSPAGEMVQMWAAYYGKRLFTLSFAVLPQGNMEHVEFLVSHEVA